MRQNTEDVTERAPSLDQNGRAAYRFATNDWDLATAVVAAVSEVAGCDLLEDECFLYDVVDPDALGRLFADHDGGPSRTNGRVIFEIQGCRVEIRADGDHLIYEPGSGDEQSTSAAQSV